MDEIWSFVVALVVVAFVVALVVVDWPASLLGLAGGLMVRFQVRSWGGRLIGVAVLVLAGALLVELAWSLTSREHAFGFDHLPSHMLATGLVAATFSGLMRIRLIDMVLGSGDLSDD